MLLASLPYTQSVLAAAVAEKDNSSVSKVDIPVTQGWPEVFLFLLLLLFHFQRLTSIGLLTYTVTHVLSLDNEYSWSWFTTAILHVGKWHLTTRFKCGDVQSQPLITYISMWWEKVGFRNPWTQLFLFVCHMGDCGLYQWPSNYNWFILVLKKSHKKISTIHEMIPRDTFSNGISISCCTKHPLPLGIKRKTITLWQPPSTDLKPTKNMRSILWKEDL